MRIRTPITTPFIEDERSSFTGADFPVDSTPHPHLHVLMSDGAFRRDGSFMALPPPDPAVLEQLWRRSVLAWFVRQGGLEQDEAAGMHRFSALEFIARWLDHVPERYETRVRYPG